jgi:hypothetical protein
MIEDDDDASHRSEKSSSRGSNHRRKKSPGPAAATAAAAKENEFLFDDDIIKTAYSLERDTKRDLGASVLNLGQNIRSISLIIFVIILITVICHGAFIVMLALKLDGNGTNERVESSASANATLSL